MCWNISTGAATCISSSRSGTWTGSSRGRTPRGRSCSSAWAWHRRHVGSERRSGTAACWRAGGSRPAWPATSSTPVTSPRCWTSTTTAAPATTWRPRRSGSGTKPSAGRWRRPAEGGTRRTCPECSPSPGGCRPRHRGADGRCPGQPRLSPASSV